MAKILMIEGARFVGKSYLVDNLNLGVQTYKFPFAKYFNDSFAKARAQEIKNDLNSKKELYYLTLGYDITILDLMKQGIITQDLIVDRGILSNIVFGIQSGRITKEEGQDAWDWLCTEYGEFFEIVYIHTEFKKDDRNKDMWGDIYEQQKTTDLYQQFIMNTTIPSFENKFDAHSVERFNWCINRILFEPDEIPGR